MRKKWTIIIQCLMAICIMSGLVACGSLTNCVNSGLIPAACGGGHVEGSFSPIPQQAAASAEGLWTGITAKGRTASGVVLDDGSYWMFYTAIGNSKVLAGLIQGTGTSHFGSFGSPNTRDFNLEGDGILAATMSGTYVQKHSFNGTLAYLNGTTGSFATAYVADYELPSNMNLMAGEYSGLRADNQTLHMTLDAGGHIVEGSAGGCTFVGSLSLRGTGNVFNITVTFGGGACSNGNDTVTGVAFYDAATRRIFSASLKGTRTNTFMFIGTKL
jgi:hypothetical protein